jgi:hypothetical protein
MIETVIAEEKGEIARRARDTLGDVQARSCWMPIQADAKSDLKLNLRLLI